MSSLSLRKIKHDSSATDNIQLNSNGNTSIATTNVANVPLEVGGSVALGRLASTAYSRFVGIGGSGGTFVNGITGGGYVEFTNDTSYNNEVHLVTHWSGNQHGRALTADYKGRVVKPYQPAFYIIYPTNGNATWSSEFGSGTGYFKWNTPVYNYGNMASNNGGQVRWTAPISGRYLVNIQLGLGGMSSSSTNSRYCEIRGWKNGSQIFLSSTSTTYVTAATYDVVNYVGIHEMSANDYMEIQLNSDNTGMALRSNENCTSYNVYLLG